MSGLVIQTNPSLAQSGLFVEPIFTYERGESDTNYPSPFGSNDGSNNGFGVGGRAGIHLYDALFVGLDGRFSMPHYLDSSVSYDAYSTSMNWGPVVGLQIPNWGMRVWGSLIVGGELDPKESSNLDLKFKETSGFRFGTGFRINSISLNLEYQELKYKETILEKIGPFASGSNLENVDFKNNSWVASISMSIDM